MTKREATRRDDQRRASSAANLAEPKRGWVARKSAPRTPSARNSAPAPTAPERSLPERAQPPPPLCKELLSRDDLRALGVPWSRSRLYKVIAAGRFPRPVSTGPNVYDRKLWRRRDVEVWLRQLRPVVEPAE
jgi:predicted DNA-binding transcriptional regulator AlpA